MAHEGRCNALENWNNAIFWKLAMKSTIKNYCATIAQSLKLDDAIVVEVSQVDNHSSNVTY